MLHDLCWWDCSLIPRRFELIKRFVPQPFFHSLFRIYFLNFTKSFFFNYFYLDRWRIFWAPRHSGCGLVCYVKLVMEKAKKVLKPRWVQNNSRAPGHLPHLTLGDPDCHKNNFFINLLISHSMSKCVVWIYGRISIATQAFTLKRNLIAMIWWIALHQFQLNEKVINKRCKIIP